MERAHTDGILTAASLMVAAPAAGDAVERARRQPTLAVGLHLTLLESQPCLPPLAIPDLIGDHGRLRDRMVGLAFEIALKARVRRQLDAEIVAQFDAFARTGLVCDHVNAHKHFHVHPVIASIVMREAGVRGIRCLRAPTEPLEVLRRMEPKAKAAGLADRVAGRWLRRRLARRGFLAPDHVFGLAWSGAMTPQRVAGLVRHLPAGTSEIYTHPASGNGWPGAAEGYQFQAELAALLSREARDAIARGEVATGGYRTMLGP